ncbi:hypothetical protein MY11210_003128 [Beauveria gryllotalpidicola]
MDAKKANHEADDAFQTRPSSSGQSAYGASDSLRLDNETKTITLLPAEQLLREFLLESSQSFPGLEIWVTGGWIRDRLLGIPSSDLDLALSNLTWTTQVAYVMLSQAVYDDAGYESGGGHDAESSRDSHARKIAWDKYSASADFISRQNLQTAHSLRPLLNGREIQQLFGLKGGGKHLKDVMDKLVEWQFDNEDATKEQCEAWLLRQRDWLGELQAV